MIARDLRPDIWRAIRRLGANGGVFDTLAVRGQLRGAVRRERIRDYCRALEAGGYLAPAEMPTDGAPGWQLLRDPGAEAPRLRPDGTPVTMGMGREAMWRALRILGACSPRELAATASTPEHAIALAEAEDYTDRLARAGFLVRLPGEGGTRYQLPQSRYTGPRSIQIRRNKEIYDPNTGRLYTAQGDLISQAVRHG